ncbi:MAG TPA: hypothetical protein VF134_04260 [Candidatus Dormibacteraeota bacterium]
MSAVNRVLGLALAALLALGVVIAVGLSIAGKLSVRPLTTVHGVIGSEKQPFFQDPAVIAAFHRNGYDVQVDTAGSRQIATSVDLSHYDFAFPAGVPAAQKIQADHHAKAVYQPFYTPMAIATWKPIVALLEANGIASEQGGYPILDMQKYLALVDKNTRWSDLANNSLYNANKSVLITSTDVRTSNSAAMYLSIASYVDNSNNIVADDTTAAQVAPKVAPIFLRQGFTQTSSEGPFTDYLTIGIGTAPMVMIYEAQYLALQTAHDPSLTSQMVLMYPNPTVYSKHTLVPLNGKGDEIGRLLLQDKDLQQLAVKYGFRTADTAGFNKYLADRGVPQPPALVNVIDPPAYEPLETMINAIDQLYKGGTA